MNLKGILLVALLALSGAAMGMSQIKSGEAVRIVIKGVPAEDKSRIDGDYPVSEQGTINLPYVGEINATGKTHAQLAHVIEKAYLDAGIYTAPAIEVRSGEIGDPTDPVIHIGGQVRRPGPIPFAEGITLWKAIQAAGGATEFGSLRRVKLYRDGKQTTYDMMQKENFSLPLKVNDTIEVPEKSFGCGHVLFQ